LFAEAFNGLLQQNPLTSGRRQGALACPKSGPSTDMVAWPWNVRFALNERNRSRGSAPRL